jgi:hypothetical protein
MHPQTSSTETSPNKPKETGKADSNEPQKSQKILPVPSPSSVLTANLNTLGEHEYSSDVESSPEPVLTGVLRRRNAPAQKFTFEGIEFFILFCHFILFYTLKYNYIICDIHIHIHIHIY